MAFYLIVVQNISCRNGCMNFSKVQVSIQMEQYVSYPADALSNSALPDMSNVPTMNGLNALWYLFRLRLRLLTGHVRIYSLLKNFTSSCFPELTIFDVHDKKIVALSSIILLTISYSYSRICSLVCHSFWMTPWICQKIKFFFQNHILLIFWNPYHCIIYLRMELRLFLDILNRPKIPDFWSCSRKWNFLTCWNFLASY